MATATATVATAPFGGAAGRETEGRGESAASEGEETGASGRRRGVARRGRGSRRWRGRVPACGEHTPRVLLARGGR